MDTAYKGTLKPLKNFRGHDTSQAELFFQYTLNGPVVNCNLRKGTGYAMVQKSCSDKSSAFNLKRQTDVLIRVGSALRLADDASPARDKRRSGGEQFGMATLNNGSQALIVVKPQQSRGYRDFTAGRFQCEFDEALLQASQFLLERELCPRLREGPAWRVRPHRHHLHVVGRDDIAGSRGGDGLLD